MTQQYKFCVEEFDDGVSLFPIGWLLEDETAAYWPTFTNMKRYEKVVREEEPIKESWPVYPVKRVMRVAGM